MIKTIHLDLTASDPNLPLAKSCVYAGSAASFTICNVPKAVGQRAITGITLSCKNVDGTTNTYTAVRVGSAWEATVPASQLATVGTVTNGIKVLASGKDENGTAASWVLGVGNLAVLDPSGSVTPGVVTHAINHEEFSSIDPETVTIADLATILKGSNT